MRLKDVLVNLFPDVMGILFSLLYILIFLFYFGISNFPIFYSGERSAATAKGISTQTQRGATLTPNLFDPEEELLRHRHTPEARDLFHS
jgi:hypothetical protein